MRTQVLRRAFAAAFLVALALSPAAWGAGLDDPLSQWLPSPDDATWTYDWTDSAYARENTREQYTFAGRDGPAFRLFWTSENQGNGPGAVSTQGLVDYNRSQAGLINLNWQSVAPPPQFPVLCSNVSNCGNSLASAHFMLIWGSRSPVLAEPLLSMSRWSSTGGVNSDVASENRYMGTERIVVPAFPDGVTAAKVQSDITQAGALGDPYGSGIRTVWWVYGVGPVRIEFRHTGGEVGLAYLVSTSLTPRKAPSDANFLPLVTGSRMKFRWRNSKHMRSWSRQQLDVVQVVNNTARVDVKSLSGPDQARRLLCVLDPPHRSRQRVSGDQVGDPAEVPEARAEVRARQPAPPSADAARLPGLRLQPDPSGLSRPPGHVEEHPAQP